nr:bifunctional epoxide hydrolase 2-like [Ipomoea batatas]
MEKIAHKTVGVNGINMHIAELGEGPLVLLIHGFPELWYSWRHQILFLAAQGYRAVAPDLRGFGDTTGAPNDDPSKFTVFHIVGDLIELLRSIAPEEEKVFVVGHDWGALIAWHLCMFRPDKVKALVNLSVHFLPRHPHLNHVQSFRTIYGNDFYISRFQRLGADCTLVWSQSHGANQIYSWRARLNLSYSRCKRIHTQWRVQE